jgi:hypothetical protein
VGVREWIKFEPVVHSVSVKMMSKILADEGGHGLAGASGRSLTLRKPLLVVVLQTQIQWSEKVCKNVTTRVSRLERLVLLLDSRSRNEDF